jgi:hypothetical protein
MPQIAGLLLVEAVSASGQGKISPIDVIMFSGEPALLLLAEPVGVMG